MLGVRLGLGKHLALRSLANLGWLRYCTTVYVCVCVWPCLWPGRAASLVGLASTPARPPAAGRRRYERMSMRRYLAYIARMQ
jgi:hypothetical protein